jgi:hypothetical protein
LRQTDRAREVAMEGWRREARREGGREGEKRERE